MRRALQPSRLGRVARVACFAGCFSALGCGDRPVDRPRGLVFVVVDTLRADHLGLYGETRGLTPRIDELAETSLVFRRAIAASSWTRPSVASMFTGRYPTTVGVLGHQDSLSEDIDTLAELLQADGLRTHAISTNGNAGPCCGFEQGFEKFDLHSEHRDQEGRRKRMSAEEITTRALAWLDLLEPDEEFFLFLHYLDPHAPYLYHEGLLPDLPGVPLAPGRDTPGTVGGHGAVSEPAAGRRAAPDHAAGPAPVELDRSHTRHLYAGEVRYTDVWMGKLFDALRERGLFDEILLIFTSDHGEGLWDHGQRGHGKDLYEEQIHIPLILRYPRSGAPPPQFVETVASHIDIAPTILTAFGLPVPEAYQGVDLREAVRSGRPPRRGDWAYSELRNRGWDLEAVTDRRTKVVRGRGFDGYKAEVFDYTAREGDTFDSVVDRMARIALPAEVSSRQKERMAHDIIAANPGLEKQEGEPGFIVEKGMVIHIPAATPPDDDMREVFELADDPEELDDLSATPPERADRLTTLLRRVGAENLVRQVEGGKVTLEDFDEQTLEQLRNLGYID